MSQRPIRYRSGYKYQLSEDHVDMVRVLPQSLIVTEYITLDSDGEITLRRGYAWDGPSGPAFDTPNFMRGSLVHDALYQLMRLGELDRHLWRPVADMEMRRMCREDGMWPIRAWWLYQGVRRFGDPAASPESRKVVLTAPR